MENGSMNKGFGVEVNGATGATGFKAWFTPYELELYNKYVGRHEYEAFRNKTTIVTLILKSGFEIVGVAGCEDPRNFKEQLGHEYALKDALRKLGEFAAFHKAEMRRLENTKVLVAPELSPFEVEELRKLLWQNEGRVHITPTPADFPNTVTSISRAGGSIDVKA